ncbi:glycerophosphodiester phosphodiesterase [Alterisphingorhabdus coralli]|uniref:glycerophosphodiester phosphodiesterase n=1 Tax=Alterisphingorhabdus coralli TaxID=3071408 RepID=A0AA97F9J2_9SPHN|nr:glycerophosphodiester phosphodiesterase [Parasphingorhabdus sp. SCSIO 66989]WOE76646.1 glycerophosphodiester phosphodiesterase [Parasphingorhabdus sp. SCSIO 66989]
MQPLRPVIIIAHRGASGERPEHTLASYERAINQGADFVEPDLVLTKDGVLVARHENEISGTTDVADHPEFADRRTRKLIDGEEVNGWFTEDFTLAELKTLRTRERLAQLRPDNARFDGLYTIPTLAEIIQLVRAKEAEMGRVIGIYPETKHPSYFASIGLSFDEVLVKQLHKAGYRGADAPVYIQSFEVENLKRLDGMTDLPLIQLVAEQRGPVDGKGLQYADMVKPAGLKQIASYADGIGPQKTMVIPLDRDGNATQPTSLVADAHAVGLKVHPWTMRRENYFLPDQLKSGDDPVGRGDIQAEVRAFIAAGVDGVFSDNVTEAVAAIDLIED